MAPDTSNPWSGQFRIVVQALIQADLPRLDFEVSKGDEYGKT
jgi:hypothetical protein